MMPVRNDGAALPEFRTPLRPADVAAHRRGRNNSRAGQAEKQPPPLTLSWALSRAAAQG